MAYNNGRTLVGTVKRVLMEVQLYLNLMAFGTSRVFSPFVVLKKKYARSNHELRKGCIKSNGIIYTGGVINND